MRFQAQAILTGIKSSKGSYEGFDFDSTTFHLSVDLPESQTGKTLGSVSRPFKCGDSNAINSWLHLEGKWPATGVPVECLFEMAAGAKDTSKLVLVQIKPQTSGKAAASSAA